ncbi:hypothetical protein B0H11DRAFT_1933421 [Mycena galericulata]|nr:hypothetical protein B0H11DRAFT_1933421 [Mycena galericulata]
MSYSISPNSPSLLRAQRLSIMRSTRKVEAILGETPRAEIIHTSATSPLPPSQPESATSLASPSPDSSFGGSRDARRPKGIPRPVLFIRLPSASYISNGMPSPLSSTSGISSNSPATPSTSFFEAEEFIARRHKMARISRTLGENIPAQLVFPSGNSARIGRRHPESSPDVRVSRRGSLAPQPVFPCADHAYGCCSSSETDTTGMPEIIAIGSEPEEPLLPGDKCMHD